MQPVPVPTPPSKPPAQSTAWAPPNLGQPWQFRFFHRIIRTFGKRPAYHLAYFVVFWYVLTSRAIRRRTRHYLDRRFPSHRGLRRFLDTFRLVASFAHSMIDVAAVRILGPSALAVNSIHNDQLLQLGNASSGLVLLNSHVGCWQIALPYFRFPGKHACAVMIPDPNTQALAAQPDAAIIDPRTGLQAVMDMTQALLAGHVVSLMGDRTFGDQQNVVRVRFLGQDVLFPLTPYRIASATGSPIGVILAPKTGFRTFEMRLARVIHVPPHLGRDPQAYAPCAQQFADTLEQFTRDFPFQFYNFFNLWQTDH
jgi:predicted LPLAT superfamily acyltransferase